MRLFKATVYFNFHSCKFSCIKFYFSSISVFNDHHKISLTMKLVLLLIVKHFHVFILVVLIIFFPMKISHYTVIRQGRKLEWSKSRLSRIDEDWKTETWVVILPCLLLSVMALTDCFAVTTKPAHLLEVNRKSRLILSRTTHWQSLSNLKKVMYSSYAAFLSAFLSRSLNKNTYPSSGSKSAVDRFFKFMRGKA